MDYSTRPIEIIDYISTVIFAVMSYAQFADGNTSMGVVFAFFSAILALFSCVGFMFNKKQQAER